MSAISSSCAKSTLPSSRRRAVLIAPVLVTFVKTGLVPRLPTAVLATGIVLVGALSLTTGIILDTVTRGRRETRLLAYLQYAAPDEAADRDDSTGETRDAYPDGGPYERVRRRFIPG